MNRLIAKILTILTVSLLGCAMTGEYEYAQNIKKLEVSFADSIWTGVRIPKEHRCRREGGDGSTPGLIVKNIPPEANAIIMEYTIGATYMRKHFYGYFGIIGFEIQQGASEVTIPSILAGTLLLPDRFFLVSTPHPAMSRPGAYFPPCGGLDGYNYLVKVSAVHRPDLKDQKSKVFGKGELNLGSD